MNIKSAILATCLLIGTATAVAVPAKRTPFTVTQPDGTTLTLRLYGDERMHFLLTDDDKIVVEDGVGIYSYGRITPEGTIVSTGITARDAVRRTVGQDALTTSLSDIDMAELVLKREKARPVHALKYDVPMRTAKSRKNASRAMGYPQKGMGRFTSNYPRTGKIKGLVVLVEYTDVVFNGAYETNAHDYFSALLNHDNFSELGATGSAAQYFREQSMGQFDPEFVLVGPVKLSQNRAYYGTNDAWGDDEKAVDMIEEACKLIDDQVNFADFDNDGDGYVDNVFVFYAGTGEASGGPAESIWPHSWELEEGGINLTLDGVKISSYACTNELQSGLPDGIGTFCHEFSHVMGLPDLYVTSMSGGNWTPDEYSILDYGPYNNNSRTPPAYSAYERNAMGWLEPIIVDKGTFITLEDIKSSNRAMLIATAKDNEFFLFENRQKTGWDEYIPGHGMLIWHIDYQASVFDNNRVNNTRSHNYVDLVEANNQAGSNMPAYPWPGTLKKTEYTYQTTPKFQDWSKNDLNLPITDITEQNGLITFNVAGGGLNAPAAEDPSVIGNEYFVATWNPVDGATDYMVTVLGSDSKQPPFEDIATFGTGTTITLPTGWTTDATDVVTSSSSVGASAPALQFTTDGQMLQTREYSSDIDYVSFWSSCSGTLYYTSTFNVHAKVNGQWQEVYIVSPARGGATSTVTMPEGARAVRIVYSQGAGKLNLDDVKVHSDGVCDVLVPEYNGASSHGETTMRINVYGYKYDTYNYYVQATDGSAVSSRSNTVTVSMPSGVDNITIEDSNPFTVSAVGTAITVIGTPGVDVHVYDAVGRPVATARANDNGMTTLTMPSSGFYIITAENKSAKIAIR